MPHFELYFDDHREDGLVWELVIKSTPQDVVPAKILNVKKVFLFGINLETDYKKDREPSAIVKGFCTEIEQLVSRPDTIRIFR